MSCSAACCLAVSALLVVGCGAGEPSAESGLRLAPGDDTPLAGQTLARFVAAAGRGDATTMWSLLSSPTRASLGPTLAGFRANAVPELEEAAGQLAGSAELVLSRSFGPHFAVAAVAGERQDEEGDREPAAYAAALRREGDGWRLELGGLVFASLRPAPLSETQARPRVETVAQSSARIERLAVWLDGEPLPVRPLRALPFTGRVSGRPLAPLPPGVHVVTAFAMTEETAGAYAWPFEVEP